MGRVEQLNRGYLAPERTGPSTGSSSSAGIDATAGEQQAHPADDHEVPDGGGLAREARVVRVRHHLPQEIGDVRTEQDVGDREQRWHGTSAGPIAVGRQGRALIRTSICVGDTTRTSRLSSWSAARCIANGNVPV